MTETHSNEMATLREENRSRLLESQIEWNRRLEAIGKDRTHARGPNGGQSNLVGGMSESITNCRARSADRAA